MRARFVVRSLALLAGWLVTAALPAQAALTAFDAAAVDLAAAGPADAATGQRAATALALFLQLPPSAGRDARLDLAVAMAFFAGRHDVAVQLAADGHDADRATGLLWTYELRALAQLGRLDQFVARGRDGEQRDQWAAVATALLAEEPRLLPLADRMLRQGRTEPALWVFQALSRAAPADAVKLANLALTFRHLGNLRASLDAYQRAVALAPDDLGIRNDLGLFQRATGMTAAAAATFRACEALDDPRGAGPAITNLVHMEVLAPGSAGIDPLRWATAGLAVRPQAAMLRKVTLDLILDRARATTAGGR